MWPTSGTTIFWLVSSIATQGQTLSVDDFYALRIIIGTLDLKLRKELLRWETLTRAKFHRIATTCDSASKVLETLFNSNNVSVAAMSSYKKWKSGKGNYHMNKPNLSNCCHRYGRKDEHAKGECFARDLTCHKCDKKGHIAPVCRSNQTFNSRSKSHQTRGRSSTWPTQEALNHFDDNPVWNV